VPHTYETNGAAIYLESFATIRAEADLARFTPDEERVAVRMIHAAGLVGLEKHVQFSENMAQIARAALADGAPILCDAHMVSEGITRTRLPADNQIICTLRDPACAGHGAADGQHALCRSAGTVAAASGGGFGGHRQRADGAVSPAQYARRPRLSATCRHHRLPRGVCRCG